MLNRSIKWTLLGIEYESDHRHTDKLIEELGLRKSQVRVTFVIREARKVRKKWDNLQKIGGTDDWADLVASSGQTGVCVCRWDARRKHP